MTTIHISGLPGGELSVPCTLSFRRLIFKSKMHEFQQEIAGVLIIIKQVIHLMHSFVMLPMACRCIIDLLLLPKLFKVQFQLDALKNLIENCTY